MAEHKALYRWSLHEAVQSNERDLWCESYKENCNCARAIEKAINRDFDGMYLNPDCAKGVIDKYGYDRVNYVLANTLKEKSEDGRFSHDNRDWSKGFYISKDDTNWHFCVESHPAVLDGFINEARAEWQKLGLFDYSYCESEKNGEIDYEGKIVAIRPDCLKDEFKTPDDQLFYVTGGFGSHANSRGRKVYGKFMKDGEETFYNRDEIIGVVKDENIPVWAAEKLETMQTLEQDKGGMTLS